MIELKHVSKVFETAGGRVEALKDISLTIPDGDVYGIIGMSGAGKSTLVRCINMLERPTSGEVIVNGKRLDTMSPAQLRAARRDITMIFQRFNLLFDRCTSRSQDLIAQNVLIRILRCHLNKLFIIIKCFIYISEAKCKKSQLVNNLSASVCPIVNNLQYIITLAVLPCFFINVSDRS